MKTFDACALPPGFDDPEAWNDLEAHSDLRVRYPILPPERWERLLDDLRAAGRILAQRPARELIAGIGRVADRLLDADDPLRREALTLLVPTAGISAAMAREVLDGMAADWTARRLDELLEREFGDPTVLDRFRRLDEGRAVRARGPGLSFHVGAGTVPGVSVTSVIRALLVKSAVLLKPGRGDVVLPVLFARALREEDPGLGRAMAVTYWPGGEEAAERQALEAADVVIAYGGADAIGALRLRTPVTTRFVAYHHRVSLGLIGREALSPDEAPVVARRAARAVSIFDQRGCVSPHVLYVEGGGAVDANAWAELLAAAMADVAAELPGGELAADEASAVHQARGAAEIREASGAGVRVHTGLEGSWTVIFDPDAGFTASCSNRVVYVKPISALEDVPGVLGGAGRHLQTVAIEGVGTRSEALADALTGIGATRVTSLERAPWPPPWWHHDGASVFDGLVRWVDLEDVGP